MLPEKKEHPKEKSKLHPRNKHRERYNFKQLIESSPELTPYVILNAYNDESIDFFNPDAVKLLNKALLKYFYGVDYWDIPSGYLCPPIPGRANYIHHLADLLGGSNNEQIPVGTKIKCLDIGVGANCIYPLIGNREYGWSFIGSDIDPVSIQSANRIIELNPLLSKKIELRLQHNPNDIFNGILHRKEYIDMSVCNPPFHSSLAEAQSGTIRKLRNLTHKTPAKSVLNFGGRNNELWCKGGEETFVSNMIHQSEQFRPNCFWFTTLISKQTTLKSVYHHLKIAGATDVKTIPMGQGNKISRMVAWTFLNPEQQKTWVNTRWKEI